MSVRRTGAITRRLLEQLRHDRRTLALLFAAPLVILSLLYFLVRGGSSRPEVAVADLDDGPVAAAVVRSLEASTLVSASTLDVPAAESRLAEGRLAAYVVLPADFSEQAKAGVLRPEVHLEGSEPGLSGTVLQAVGQALLGAAAFLPAPPGTRPPRAEPLVTYRYGGPGLDMLDYLGGAFVGLVVFFLVFVVTCVSFLRERSQGTLERLMASPLRRSEIVVGYVLAFTLLALLQSLEVLLFSIFVLRVHNAGNLLLVFGVEILLALAALNLGIFLSVFARTEFQAVQFIPLVVAPQILLSGIIFPVSSEPGWLQVVSRLLPLTYAVDALRDVMLKGADLSWPSVRVDAAVLTGFCLLMVGGAAGTLRRRVA